MTEYIERGAAIHAVDLAIEMNDTEYAKVCNELNKVSAANVAPVVHGQWILLTDMWGDIEGERCSMCGTEFCTEWSEPVFSNYCPSCGAKMDGVTDG